MRCLWVPNILRLQDGQTIHRHAQSRRLKNRPESRDITRQQCHRHIEETRVASCTSRHPACGYITARQQDSNKSTNPDYRHSTMYTCLGESQPISLSTECGLSSLVARLDAAMRCLLFFCQNAEFSVMLTYNTADDLPGPSRLQPFMRARLSSTSTIETKAISALFRAAQLITFPRHIHLSRALGLSPPFQHSKFVRLLRAKTTTKKPRQLTQNARRRWLARGALLRLFRFWLRAVAVARAVGIGAVTGGRSVGHAA